MKAFTAAALLRLKLHCDALKYNFTLPYNRALQVPGRTLGTPQKSAYCWGKYSRHSSVDFTESQGLLNNRISDPWPSLVHTLNCP